MKIKVISSAPFFWYKNCIGKIFDVSKSPVHENYLLTRTENNEKNLPEHFMKYYRSGTQKTTELGIAIADAQLFYDSNQSAAPILLAQSELEVK